MGDVQTAIDGTLESAEDTGTGGGTVQTNVKNRTECLRLTINAFNTVVFSIDISLTLVDGIQTKLLQNLFTYRTKNTRELTFAKRHKLLPSTTFNLWKIKRRTYTTSQKESSTVCCGIVGQTDLQSVAWQFMTVSSSHNHVSFKSGIRDLKFQIDVTTGYTPYQHNCTMLQLINKVVFIPG